MHDSGSGWFAKPFLYDSFIHYSTPVYPGALRSLLGVAVLGTTVGFFIGMVAGTRNKSAVPVTRSVARAK
jgi:hypothetical protein